MTKSKQTNEPEIVVIEPAIVIAARKIWAKIKPAVNWAHDSIRKVLLVGLAGYGMYKLAIEFVNRTETTVTVVASVVAVMVTAYLLSGFKRR